MHIELQIEKILRELPDHVKLVAVSKTQSIDAILKAYKTGHKIFGENKVQELIQKYSLLPKDIEWHLIGHLQSNKVKNIVAFISMIHSVDSLKLLETINSEAEKINRIIPCLLQIKIAKEDTKYGLNIDELKWILDSGTNQFKNIKISGLMGMATFTTDEMVIRDEFMHCKHIFEEIKTSYFLNDPIFKELSMGMSDDYQIAIEEGSTIVRIGSKIFGQRIYLS